MSTWLTNDPVAAGVLETVAARNDVDHKTLYAWGETLGEERFYALLRDETGDVETFFVALVSDEEIPEDLVNYDRNVGPAVDRIEDAWTAS